MIDEYKKKETEQDKRVKAILAEAGPKALEPVLELEESLGINDVIQK